MFAIGLVLFVLTSILNIIGKGESWYARSRRVSSIEVINGAINLIGLSLMLAATAVLAWRVLP